MWDTKSSLIAKRFDEWFWFNTWNVVSDSTPKTFLERESRTETFLWESRILYAYQMYPKSHIVQWFSMARIILIGFLVCGGICMVSDFRSFSVMSYLVQHCLRQCSRWFLHEPPKLTKRSCWKLMMMIWPHLSHLGPVAHSWMRMPVLGLFLLLARMSVWMQMLSSLIMLLKYGPSFVSAMSHLVNLPILSVYIKSSCYNKVTVQLRSYFKSYLGCELDTLGP